MRVNKLVAGIISVVAISTATVSALTVNGAEDSVKIEVSNATVTAGSEFTIDVSLSNIPEKGIQGTDFAIKYDSSLVSIDSVNAGSLVETGAEDVDGSSDTVPIFDASIDTETSTIVTYFGTSATDSSYWMHGEGVMFTITGTVLADAEAGAVANFDVIPVPRVGGDATGGENSSIWLGYYTDITSDEGTIVCYDIETVSGSVTVDGEETGMKGDANCDGKVAVADAVAVSAYVSNATKNVISEQGIINADVHMTGNNLNASDALMIQQYATGIITAF